MPCKPLWCVYGDYVIPQRYILILMICVGIMIAYSARICLYISITEIVKCIEPSEEQRSSSNVCPKFDNEKEVIDVKGGTYDWTQIQESIVLTSFFPGYFVSHLPGGIISDKLGGRHVFCLGVLITGIVTVLTPAVIIYTNWQWLSVLRFVLGLAQGVLYPSTATLLANWVPLRQRSLLVGIAYSGVQMGSIFGYLFSGIIIIEFGSWPAAFYFWGIWIFAWYFLSYFTCFSKPSSHPYITQEESQLLRNETEDTRQFKVPWKKIMSDPAVLSLIAVQYAHDWITYTLIIDLPKYFKEVLRFNIRTSSMVISASFAFTCVGSIISGFLSDFLIHHNLVTTIHIRKIYGLISCLAPSASAILATHAGCNQRFVVGLLWVGMLCMGPWFTGPKVNHLDISLKYSGVLMSIINGIGVTAGLVTPYVVVFVSPDGTQEQWQCIFWIAFLLSIACTGIYVIWGSAERSQWDLETEAG